MFEYIVKKDDTLPILSAKFFGNTSDYLKIYYANPQIKGRGNGRIDKEGYIVAGEVLKIPVFQQNAAGLRNDEAQNELCVLINGKETKVSSLCFNAGFDSFSNSFSFECPFVEKEKISPLGYERITIEIGGEEVLNGIIEKISTDGNGFLCSGKSITSLLENTCVSGSDLGFSFDQNSIDFIANRFAEQYGLNFKSDKNADDLADKVLPVVEISETERISSVLSKLGQELGLYICCDNMNNLYFRKIDYLGENIAVIDLSDGSDGLLIRNLKIDYDGGVLHSIYSLYLGGDEEVETLLENRVLSVCKTHRIKRIKADKEGQEEEILDTEIRKALVECVKISFCLPFVKIKNKLIACGDTFDLTAPDYGIKQKTKFFITDVSFKFTHDSQSCKISACLAFAVSGDIKSKSDEIL